MVQKLWRSRLTRWAVAVLVFIAAGYFSNAITATACERKTSHWLNHRLAAHPTNWPGRHAWPEPAKYRLPWIVAVDYEWVVGNLGGEWGTRYYFTLFGIPVPLGNHIRLMS